MRRTIPIVSALIVSACALSIPTISQAAPTPRGVPIAITCTGPIVAAGRRIAAGDKLALGLDPKACFGKMQIYDGPNYQYVAVAPSRACPGGSAMDVYEQSRAGSWHSYFEKPVCGSKVSIGPKDQWGDWMLTIDGKHYDSRGDYYILVP